jgi:hypothetical protein
MSLEVGSSLEVQPAAASAGGFVLGMNVKADYGAAGDGVHLIDGVVSGTSLSSASAEFTDGDIGKLVHIERAGASGLTVFSTTIAARVSNTAVTLAQAAPTAVASGADVVYGTDDTEAIQAALDAAGILGAAKLLFPASVYLVTHLELEARDFFSDGMVSVHLCGEGTPVTLFGTVPADLAMPYGGSIIKGGATSGGPLFNAAASSGSFSAYIVTLEDICFRLYENPQTDGVNLEWANQVRVKGTLQIDSNVYSASSIEPTANNTCAFRLPRSGNGALSDLDNVSLHGFWLGFQCGEHFHVDYMNVSSCLHAGEFLTSNHGSTATRICAQRCPFGLVWSGAHSVDIAQFDIEHTNPASHPSHWSLTDPDLGTYDIYDPSNQGRGHIRWWAVLQDAPGVPDGFSKSGGKNLLCERVGDFHPNVGVFTIGTGDPLKQSIPNNVETNMALNVVYDDERIEIGSAAYKIDGPSGMYDLDLQIAWDANASGHRVIKVYKVTGAGDILLRTFDLPNNGANVLSVALPLSFLGKADAQEFAFTATQDSGGALNLAATITVKHTRDGLF